MNIQILRTQKKIMNKKFKFRPYIHNFKRISLYKAECRIYEGFVTKFVLTRTNDIFTIFSFKDSWPDNYFKSFVVGHSTHTVPLKKSIYICKIYLYSEYTLYSPFKEKYLYVNYICIVYIQSLQRKVSICKIYLYSVYTVPLKKSIYM